MNKFNLTKLERYGVLAQIVSTENGSPVLAINLPNQRIGFEGPPHPFASDKFSPATAHIPDAARREFFESDESCACVARVLDALAQQGQAAAVAYGNRQLSADGKLARAVDAMVTSLTVIGTQYARLLQIEANLAKEYDSLYAVPDADAAAAIVDVEIRQEFRREPLAEQMKAFNNDGPDLRTLLALKRCPLRLYPEVSARVRDAWVNRVALIRPEQAATLKIAQDNNGWARRFTKYVAGVAANPSLTGTFHRVDRFQAYVILKSTGGQSVLEFTDFEIGSYEGRLKHVAAA